MLDRGGQHGEVMTPLNVRVNAARNCLLEKSHETKEIVEIAAIFIDNNRREISGRKKLSLQYSKWIFQPLFYMGKKEKNARLYS